MSSPNGNGAKALWSAIGLLSTLILSAGGWTITKTIATAERMSSVEAHQADIVGRLQSIEQKVDRLLDRQR
jgi:hypothetical protein